MPTRNWFIKLMNREPFHSKHTKSPWSIDESKCLSIEEVAILRTCCTKIKERGLKRNKFSLIRNWFMVELGLNTGLRVEEMASLRHGQCFLDKGKSSIVITGKGDKKRAVWISEGFRKTCLVYFGYKQDFGYSSNTDKYVLNNLRGTKISKRSLQKFFKSIVVKADLPEHYHVHCLRHTYTTFLLTASNHNYRFAQKQLGHSSLRTTQVYAGVVEEQGRKALEKLLSIKVHRSDPKGC